MMIPLKRRVETFVLLGKVLTDIGEQVPHTEIHEKEVVENCLRLNNLTSELTSCNGWFDEGNVRYMLRSIGKSLSEENLQKWTSLYQLRLSEERNNEKTIGLVMAGNIPAVGFHDFISVLITGQKVLAKLSADDDQLIPAIADVLFGIEPGFHKYIQFTKDTLTSFDAVIATGSDNTARYFDYYFSSWPHIIRKNRNGVAILSGDETDAELQGLADDIFLYYGLGCRNVSKVFIPAGYDFTRLLNALQSRKTIIQNHKYFNNYEYNKAIFLVNGRPHLDTGNLLLVEDVALASPVSVLYYEYYQHPEEVKRIVGANTEKIQCLVTHQQGVDNRNEFGKSQQPQLWDYADGVDTLDFILGL